MLHFCLETLCTERGCVSVELHEDIERVVFSEEDLARRVREMGAQIAQDYAGKDVLVVSVLKGAAVFMADLVRAIDLPLEMDFMVVSSYGDAAKSSGVVRIVKDLDASVEGRHVLIAEDVLDTGLTLRSLLDELSSRGAASVEVAALLRKDTPGQADVACRYVGFACPNEFIVGYGLDFAERYRNLPYIGVLKEHIYH